LVETRTPFEHVIIDLSRKPADFLELSPTGMVPLLQLDDGTLVTESVPVSRRIATEFADQRLLPPRDAPTIDGFVSLWTSSVEPAYYEILRAETEPQARFACAGYIESLAAVEELLFASAMRRAG
jgi:glutathione S-transferase